MNANHYDAIFIGSGIGALTTAAILAKRSGKRVLVLEKHYQLGGLTHTFRRPGGNEWDVGVHYIGDMNEGATMRRISDYISNDDLRWSRMNDPFDVFEYPELTFGQIGDKRTIKMDLKATFPDDRKAIDGYFGDLKIAQKYHGLRLMDQVVPKWMRPMTKFGMSRYEKICLATVGEIIDRRTDNKALKAVLLSQWGDYGLGPSEAAFATHALVANHYLHGGFYPEGGAASMADAIVPVIEGAGGECLINHHVERIIIKNGCAVGVEVRKKKGKSGGEIFEYYSDKIVSGAGAYLTYDSLLPPELGKKHADELAPLLPDLTSACLYIAFKDDPSKLGFKGENRWIFDSYDHDAYMKDSGLTSGRAKGAYLSIPSLKDPKSETWRAELIGFVRWQDFEKWQGTDWMDRGEDYQALKDKIAESLLALVEERHPGFRDLVAYYDISTPLSTEHFTGAPRGGIYGSKGTPARYKAKALGVRTPIKGLYLTGADAYSFGVAGAMISGLATAGVLTGSFGFFQVWKDIMGDR